MTGAFHDIYAPNTRHVPRTNKQRHPRATVMSHNLGMRDRTHSHSNVRHVSFECVTWLIRMHESVMSLCSSPITNESCHKVKVPSRTSHVLTCMHPVTHSRVGIDSPHTSSLRPECVYTYLNVCTRIWTCVHVFERVGARQMYTYIYICIYIYKYVCNIYIYTHICIYIITIHEANESCHTFQWIMSHIWSSHLSLFRS